MHKSRSIREERIQVGQAALTCFLTAAHSPTHVHGGRAVGHVFFHSFILCIYVCVFRRYDLVCVCILNTNIILQLLLINNNNMPGSGKPFLVIIIVFYSTEWKISFIDGHFPLNFDIINRAAVNGLLSFFPSLCPLRCVA